MTDETAFQDDCGDRSTTPRQCDSGVGGDLDAWLDEALELTFPASDPVASPPRSLRKG